MNKIEIYETRDALFEETARSIAQSLTEAIKTRGEAVFVGSGGSTPKPVYQNLTADETVPWEKVTVTLTDERRAPPSANVDNASMVKECLITGHSRFATFVGLDDQQSLSDVPARFASVLMGMGGDGHFASIFPHSEGSEAALKGEGGVILPVTPDPLPEGAPYPRWTLSKPALCNTDSMILLITGEDKKAVLEQAMEDGPVLDLPIRALLRDENLPLRILWAA
ncbi:6-phosphogluconolactonase [Parvularcula sp. LCG005]|uniref:6-phosphogluconolactonase n=1 Tax=Parvularcula sp. LCG005 TaxID=3078805 RepID=UPI002943C853|nr:6-phosphogluconolactonase [Parvularcula sp. LCG005]WOI53055.1 6-phosphogluconolactonase [Parvularcula sp. LCG005]